MEVREFWSSKVLEFKILTMEVISKIGIQESEYRRQN
jgi:hypothetical protein